jgi:hypothetical protein
MVVVNQGFVTAKTLLQRNLAAPGLKDIPKPFWPATEGYRRMITLGVNVSYASTEAMVQQIDDPVLREYDKDNACARSLRRSRASLFHEFAKRLAACWRGGSHLRPVVEGRTCQPRRYLRA